MVTQVITDEDMCDIETGSEGFLPNVTTSKTSNMVPSDMSPTRALTPNSGSTVATVVEITVRWHPSLRRRLQS